MHCQNNRRKAEKEAPIPLIGLFLSAFLSSSCCLLQLALNALSIGCVGFKILTPYKSFLWATSAAFGWVWWRNTDKKMTTRGFIVLAVLLLALSEEALTSYNTKQSHGECISCVTNCRVIRSYIGCPSISSCALGVRSSYAPVWWDWWLNVVAIHSALDGIVTSTRQGLNPPKNLGCSGGDVDPTSTKHMLFEIPKMGCQSCAAKLKKAVLAAYPKGEVQCSADVRTRILEVEARVRTGGAWVYLWYWFLLGNYGLSSWLLWMPFIMNVCTIPYWPDVKLGLELYRIHIR